jgi:hypothetical protein
MLAVSVLCVAFAAGFILLGEGVRGIFHNVRTTVEAPYP